MADKQGVDIVLYNRTGSAVTYSGVDTITTDTPTDGETATFTYGEVVDGTEIDLALADGDQTVTVPSGKLVREATIKKPETLTPDHIKKGVDVAGVVGTFAGDEAEKTVELYMADGDQIVNADEDTVMTKVTIKKPETLVPENITKDIEIAGVVGAAESEVMAYRIVTLRMSTGGLYAVIGSKPLSYLSLHEYIGVPSNATILAAAFSFAVNYSDTVKPTVYPESGKHPFSSYYSGSYLIFEASASFSRSGSQNAATLSGMVTYTLGKEAFFIETMSLVHSPMLGAYEAISEWTTSKIAGYDGITELYEDARAIRMNQYSNKIRSEAFANAYAITIQHGDIIDSAFYSVTSLQAVQAIEASQIGLRAFRECYNLKKVEIPNATTIGDYAFYYCSALSMVSLPKVTTIGGSAFASCSSLQSVILPNATTIGDYAFYYCSALSMVSLPKVTTIGSNGLHTSALRSVYLLGSIVPQLKNTYDFGYSLSLSGHIYVRQSMLDEFKASSIWSMYKSCIVGLTDDEIAELED